MELGMIFAAWLSVMTAFGVSDARINEMKAQVQAVQVRVAEVQEENTALKNKVASLEMRLANEKDVKNALAGENDFLKTENDALRHYWRSAYLARQEMKDERDNLLTWQKEAVAGFQARDVELQAKHETILAQQDRIAGFEILAARGLESAKKVNKLRAEVGTLQKRVSTDADLIDEKNNIISSLGKQVAIANESARTNSDLYQNASKTSEKLGMFVFWGLIGGLILLAIAGAVIIKLAHTKYQLKKDNGRFEVEYKALYNILVDSRAETEDAKEAKDKTMEALNIVISERNKLRQRVSETEHQNFEAIVVADRLQIRDKETVGKSYPQILYCPGGDDHPEYPHGRTELKPKNWSKHFRRGPAVIDTT